MKVGYTTLTPYLTPFWKQVTNPSAPRRFTTGQEAQTKPFPFVVLSVFFDFFLHLPPTLQFLIFCHYVPTLPYPPSSGRQDRYPWETSFRSFRPLVSISPLDSCRSQGLNDGTFCRVFPPRPSPSSGRGRRPEERWRSPEPRKSYFQDPPG